MKCFMSVMAEGKAACHHLHSPGVGQCVPGRGCVQFHVCHWSKTEAATLLLSWQPARQHDGKYCCRCKKRQSCCTSGLLISKDSLSGPMGTHGATVPLETRDAFFINQWNNVQDRYEAWCGVWVEVSSLVLFWSAFHFVLELLSEKQELFQCSQVYSCFSVAWSWLIFELDMG